MGGGGIRTGADNLFGRRRARGIIRQVGRLGIALAFALVVAVPSVAVPSSGHAINQTIRATAFTFIPAVMVILDDDTLTFNNLDPLSILLGGHTVTADTPPGGVPLFDTPFVDFNTSQPVKRPNGQGIDTLQPDTYLFHCANHPDMHGVLQILPV